MHHLKTNINTLILDYFTVYTYDKATNSSLMSGFFTDMFTFVV